MTEADTKEKVRTFNGKVLVLKNFLLVDLSNLGSFRGINLASKADNAKTILIVLFFLEYYNKRDEL